MRRALLSLLLAALGGCTTAVLNQANNAPLTPDTPPLMGAPEDIVGENAIALSFSGGGLRAAAFAHGVLAALGELRTADGDLLDDLTFISSVSGGSLAAAHYGLYGRAGLAHFREQVLLRDFERDMRLSLLHPANLVRLLVDGGLNARENFDDTLDRQVFRGATFADLYRRPKPDIRIHATDLYHRMAFPFTPRVFSILCSDLRSFRVAEAVAASMAVPLVFAPVVVRTYPESCQYPVPPMLAKIRADPDAPRLQKAMELGMSAYRDPKRMRFVKLVDGGVTDNLGLSTLLLSRAVHGTPYAPMSQRDAVKIRRMLFVVVDATRGPSGDWALREAGPSGVDVALHASDAATDASARLAADAFGQLMKEWQQAVIAFRCSLAPEEVARLGGPADFRCADVKFSLAFLSIDRLEAPYREKIDAVPTRLRLDAAQVDAVVAGARAGTLALPRLHEYLRERVQP